MATSSDFPVSDFPSWAFKRSDKTQRQIAIEVGCPKRACPPVARRMASARAA